MQYLFRASINTKFGMYFMIIPRNCVQSIIFKYSTTKYFQGVHICGFICSINYIYIYIYIYINHSRHINKLFKEIRTITDPNNSNNIL